MDQLSVLRLYESTRLPFTGQCESTRMPDIAIIDSTANLIKIIQSCKNANKESKRLVRELSYVRGLLTTLKDTVEDEEKPDDDSTGPGLLLSGDDGLIHQFQQLLDLLDLQIRGPSCEKGFKRVKHVLEWPYKESETTKLIEAVERYKGLFGLTLEDSHIRLSKSMSADLAGISRIVKDVLQETKQSSQELQRVQIELHEFRKEGKETHWRVDRLIENSEKSSQLLQNVQMEVNQFSVEGERTRQGIETLTQNAGGQYSLYYELFALSFEMPAS